MKKRIAALVLCLLLTVRLAIPPAEAAGSVFFTAAGIDILSLDDATMPFWSNGYLYVAATIFTGRVNQVLEAAYLPYTADDVCILYSGGRALRFEEGKNYAQTPDGSTFSPGAILRGGVFCVPVGMVAGYFGFEYSVISLGNPAYAGGCSASLLWMRRPDLTASLGLTDREFARAASYPMGERYTQYIQAQEAAQQPPEKPEPPPQTPPEPPEDGKTVRLCLAAGDNAAGLLDALDAYGAKAAFFCGRTFLEERGDLLRRMTASGHTVGLLEDAGDEDLVRRLEEDNLLLRRATQGKTRLVMLENAGEAGENAVREAGYCCVSVPAGGALRGNADSAAKVTPGGLRTFLASAEKSEHLFLALTETSA